MKLLRGFTIGVCAVYTLMFLIVVGFRLVFPHELEWMTGSVLDHVERIRQGKPLYAAPTVDWIPYLYPPLYYGLAALIGKEFLGARLISIAATGIQAVCIHRLSVRTGASRFWSIVAVGLFFACYGYTGGWYDLDRTDSLFVALALVTTVVLVESKTVGGAILAGALLGVDFFAKQQALIFIPAGVIALALIRERARAVAFGATAAAVVLIGTLWLDARSHGWFSYYIFKMPAAHGITWRLLYPILIRDLGRGFLLVTGTGAACVFLLREKGRNLLFCAMLVAAFLAGVTSRLHIGGWVNVLQIWTSFAVVATAVFATRMELLAEKGPLAGYVAAALCSLTLLQLGSIAYDPTDEIPDSQLARGMVEFESNVHRLERRGEVLVVGRGHVTHARHFQMAALVDVIQSEHGAPSDLLEALRRRRFAAIVDDAREMGSKADPLWPPSMLEDLPDVREALFENYFIAERLEEGCLPIRKHAPAQPRFVYLPRHARLEGMSPDQLKQRQAIEVALADHRTVLAVAGRTPEFGRDEIETLAARVQAGEPPPLGAN